MSHHERRQQFRQRREREAEARQASEAAARVPAMIPGPSDGSGKTVEDVVEEFDRWLDGVAGLARVANQNAAMNAAENLYRIQWLQMHGIMPGPGPHR
jgi:hypothetical protein